LEEAVTIFHKIVALLPSDAEAYLNLAILLMRLCRHEEAVPFFVKSV
jgi:Flp pilus assembly protein TadD